MARIPWWIWVGFGAGIYFIADRMGEEMTFFSYLGLFFIVVGIFKILVYFIVGGKKHKVQKEVSDLRTHQFTCPRCRAVVASSYRFCPHCAARLR